MTGQVEKLRRNRYFLEGVPDIPHSSRNHVEDWEEYHLPLLRMHHASLHGWGIAGGLEVSVTADGDGVEVQPGVAVDGQGELIALSASGQADISVVEPGEADRQIGAPFRLSTAGLAGQVRYLTIQYVQRLRLTEGVGGQLEQTPWLRLQAVEGEGAFVEDGVSIILAVVAVDAAGVTTVHGSLPTASRPRRLLDTSAETLRLRRTTAAGSVGQASAGEIGAVTGGLRISVADANDRMTLASMDGSAFRQLAVAAQATHLQGDLQVAGAATFTGELRVGSATASSILQVTGELRSEGSLFVTGDARVQGSLQVQGIVDAADILKSGQPLRSSQWETGTTGIHFSGGNVGIGADTPVDKLTVREGDIRIEGGRYRRLKIVSDSYWAGIELVAREQGEGGNPHIDFTHGDLDAPNYGIRLYAPSNDQFIIDGSNVGVTGALSVSGAIQAGNSDLYFTKVDHNHTGFGNTAGYAAIENAANYGALMILGRAGTSKGRYVRLWDYFQVNGSMDITGNLGVGTPNPQQRLHVAGSYLRVDGAGNEQSYIGGDGFGNDVQLGSFNPNVANAAFWNVATGTRMNLYVNDLRYSGSLTRISDARLKTNVAPVVDVLEKLASLQGVSYEWNEQYDGFRFCAGQREIGLIAQEVEAMFPELVSTWGDQGYKGIDYTKLTVVLLEALKELKAKNEAQTTRIERLEAQGRTMQ